MVPELPPAPAARVLEGRAFLTDSLWSAAARRRIAERGPPGGEPARAIEVALDFAAGPEESGPDSGPEVRGDEGRAEACEFPDQQCFSEQFARSKGCALEITFVQTLWAQGGPVVEVFTIVSAVWEEYS